MKFKKEEVVSARLHESTKAKLYKTGHTAAEAIELFVYRFSKDKEAIERDMLKIKLENLGTTD